MEHSAEYEAWIDVGGTFTDCFAVWAGQTPRNCKLLSTGSVPVAVGRIVDQRTVDCPQLEPDAPGFWTGAVLNVWHASAGLLATFSIVDSRAGRLVVGESLAEYARGAAAENYRWEVQAQLEAPVLAVRRALQIPLSHPLPPGRVRLGTTRGTNALLTRCGARVALAITSPFEDLLAIGDQTRPDLFALDIRQLPPLAERTVGIVERLDASGAVLSPLDLATAAEHLTAARDAGCHSLAVCLMHSYVNPVHEQQLERLARDLGFAHISCSHRVAPLIELVARAQTTVVDAYLSPIIRSYLDQLIEQFGGHERTQLDVMTSAGGLTPCDQFAGKDSILSGPAGGIVALDGIRRALGLTQLFGLDMGGTSTDVCRVSNEHALQYESNKAGVRILTPTLPIETVAAGGGSICWFDGVALRVGPHSAGASPGPACYGRGGPLTLTDLNVFLGRLPSSQFPFVADEGAIVRRLDEALSEVGRALPIGTRQQLAEGFRRLANEQMAGAVHTVSLAQGVDPRGSTLVGFGGAAGQHICEIAQLLSIGQIVDVPTAGLLSAQGMGLADLRTDAPLAVYQPLDQCDWSELDARAAIAARGMESSLLEQGIAPDRIRSEVWCELRYQGTDNSLSIARNTVDVTDAFHREHERRFGYQRPTRGLELVSLRVECRGMAGQDWPPAVSLHPSQTHPRLTADLGTPPHLQSPPAPWPTVARANIAPGELVYGPLIVLNAGSTLSIDAGWQGECLSDGSLRLVHVPVATAAVREVAQPGTGFDPVLRDCLSKRLSSIAQQMGVVLQQTAVSVNVKQRRDFSCAVFDARGRLLANAPHVPVHLGAMGTTVRHLMTCFPAMQPGDCFVTNDPFCGGSHLPDITVVTPIFAAGMSQPQMFVANRAHHADIGGVAPGSMSVLARNLREEGVVIPPLRLVAGAEDRSPRLAEMLRQSPYPPRNIAENMADLAAQQAANQRGVALLNELSAELSWTGLAEYSQYILQAAAQRVENFLLTSGYEESSFVDYLDDGTPLAVRISFPRPGRLHLDFTGTGGVSTTNFNANPSIVTAAVLYVLRCLIADDMPLNEGILDCVDLHIPPGILNPPLAVDDENRPAVAAGNVETSQRIVDILLAALGAAAASQGTMNNLLFGNERFGFYETICGGAGATATAAGASGVHTHMTNTRLTDPEILELRYPVRLLRFGFRPGSGGVGRHRGGDGVQRELEFLEPVELSLLTSRRGPHPPFGLAGGGPGQFGCNTLIPASNTLIQTEDRAQQLANCCHLRLEPGDRIRIETPGGGGYGEPVN